MTSQLLAWLRKRIGDDGRDWMPAPTAEADLRRLDEMPRFPIRTSFLLMFLSGLIVFVGIAWKLGNPLAEVKDPRLGLRYNRQPLTSLAGSKVAPAIWIGSSGGGIKVFDTQHHYFRQDITSRSTKGKMLGDFVHALAVQTDDQPLAAVALTDSGDGPAAVQLASFGFSPGFWGSPVVGMARFNEITDTNASCVAATADNSLLVIGTRGAGLAIYNVPSHSWVGRVTSRDGLPSDVVNDLAIVSGASRSVLWVGTADGLCGGRLEADGRFTTEWTYDEGTGLAGRSVKRLLLDQSDLWYVTEGGGLGRVQLQVGGAPLVNGAGVALVTERSIPGLQEESLRWVRGGSMSRDTWFVGSTHSGVVVGRHRESPYDTAGAALPSGLNSGAIQCTAADPASAKVFLLGTDDGAHFFLTPDTPGGGSMSPIASGFAGLKGLNVLEAAISGRTAVVKDKVQGCAAGLFLAEVGPESNWTWTRLVGTNRFDALNDASRVQCAATDGQRVFMGTDGLGIGVWDRKHAELRLEYHTSLSGSSQLRSDTSLDLAYTDGKLVQVTGDYGVDVLTGTGRTTLVPPEAMPMWAAELVAADANGSVLVCAGSRRVAKYDMRDFTWTELPGLPDIERLAVARSRIWALTSSKMLFHLPMGEGERAWQQEIAGVVDWAVSPETVHVLVRAGAQVGVHAFSAEEGTRTSSIVPRPRTGGAPAWQFAAIENHKLWLAGGEQGIEVYDLQARSWGKVEFSSAVRTPISQAQRSSRKWWFLDRQGTLHSFNFFDRTITIDVEQNVERLDVARNAASALLRDVPKGDRLVKLGEDGAREVVIGARFGGDLGRLADMIAARDELLAVQEGWIGRYNWKQHSWSSFQAPIGGIARFHHAGGSVWIESSSGNETIPYVLGQGAIAPVMRGAEPVSSAMMRAEADRLLILSRAGSVLSVSPGSPEVATAILLAERMPGAWPAKPSLVASLGGAVAVADGQRIHVYGLNEGPAGWTSLELTDSILRLCSLPEGQRLMAVGERSIFTLDGSARQPQAWTPPGVPAAGDLVGASLGKDTVAAAVLMQGETGARVWVGSKGDAHPVIGEPLPSSAPTRTVLEPSGRRLLRLDTAGRVGLYQPATRSWRAESTVAPLDQIWAVGETVFGWSKESKSLYRRQPTGTWQSTGDFDSLVQGVEGFPSGLLLRLADRSIGVRWEQAASGVRRPRERNGFPSGFGAIADVAEAFGALYLRDTMGNLAIFDWNQQRWCGFKGAKVVQLVPATRGMFIVEERNGQKMLSGPITFNPDGASPQPVAAVTQVVVLAGQIFYLASDRSVYHLGETSFERVWGGTTTSPLAGVPSLEAAVRADNEFWLVLGFSGDQSVLLRVQPDSLSSSFSLMPPGRLEQLLPLDQGGISATIVGTNGRAVFQLPTMHPLTSFRHDLTEILLQDGKFIGLTETNSFVHDSQAGWVPNPPEVVYDEQDLGQMREAAEAGLLRLPLVPADRGWLAPSTSGQIVAVALTNTAAGEPNAYLLPARDRLALAHETATGVATDGNRLFVATPGGVLEFASTSRGTPAALRNLGPNGPIGEILSVEWAGGLYCKTASADWELVGGVWTHSQPPSESALNIARTAASLASLKTWRWTPGRPQSIERLFPANEWRTCELGPDGFTFERIAAAEVTHDALMLYSSAGTLVFRGKDTTPHDLLPSWTTPPVLASASVIRLDEQTVLLTSGEPSPRQVWVRGQTSWDQASVSLRDALERRLRGPLLDTTNYLWHRPSGTGFESVTDRSGITALAGFFRPETGRFAWDTCLALGQVREEHWMLTPLGLFRIGPAGIETSSLVPVEGASADLAFAHASGDMPGALTRGNRVEWIFDGGWKPVSQAASASLDQVAAYAHVTSNWRVARNGGVERALPQSAGIFALVSVLPDGRWDFEAVNDFAGGVHEIAVTTALGVSILSDTGELKELWPMPGATGVGRIQELWKIETARGRRQLDRGKWSPSASREPLHKSDSIIETASLRIERGFPGVTMQFRPNPGEPFVATALSGKRFVFDEPFDAAIGSGGAALTVTKLGLMTMGSNGELSLEEIVPARFTDGRYFCRVIEAEAQSSIYTSDRTGSAWSYQQGWSRPPVRRTASEVFALSRSRLALGSEWRVSISASGAIEFELRFADEPQDASRRVSLAHDHSGFAFDSFTSIALQGDNRIILGSHGGLQRLDGAGAIQRLWGDRDGAPQRDGIPLHETEKTVTDAAGGVQVVTRSEYYLLPAVGDNIKSSNAEAFNRASAHRHSDQAGWTVELDTSRNVKLKMRWKGEVVSLKNQADGTARFRHNIVNGALQTSAGLWLATDGGLVVLPSPTSLGIERMSLVVNPFLSVDASGQETPVPATWLARASGRDSVLVAVGSPGAGMLQGTSSNPAGLAPIRGQPLVPEPVAQDDLLVWKRPGPGPVRISFTPGWVFPDKTLPRIGNGTFTFLDLDVRDVSPIGGSLSSTTNRIVWATRAGLVTMTPGSATRWRLQAQTESGSSLANASSIVFDAQTDTAWADADGGSYRLDNETELWTRDNRSFLLDAGTPRTEWLVTGPRLRHSDLPEAPWLDEGKPAIDRVFDLAVVPDPEGPLALVASAGGVVAYRADSFEHVRVEAAGFRLPSHVSSTVTELAWWAGEKDSPARLCARSNGRGFERVDARWREEPNVTNVFELSYRRVRQQDRWNWSRHPRGLSVELSPVNGPAIWLGQGLDASRLPIFSRGRMAIDDIRCLAFAGNELLLGSALGVVHRKIDPAAQVARLTGIDLWVVDPLRRQPAPLLTNVAGLFVAEGVLAWNQSFTFTNAVLDGRDWAALDLSPADLFASRSLNSEQGTWVVDQSGAQEFSVLFELGDNRKRFYLPAEPGSFQHLFSSKEGLWLLSNGRLYHCNLERLNRALGTARSSR